MSGSEGCKVNIMDKEYLVACPDDERDALEASAKYLSDKMSEIRASGKVVGIDRIAVMAGLNIAHEAIESGATGSGKRAKSVGARLNKLNNRIEKALARYRQTELN
ncbi:MAG: cell division protein ZapA [Gammaproteobacteria bacterium]|jgi:cell division protein ZapA